MRLTYTSKQYTYQMLANTICENGYPISRKNLVRVLKEDGYLIDGGDYDELPQKRYENGGLFFVEKTVRKHAGMVIISLKPFVTAKGVEYFLNIFAGK